MSEKALKKYLRRVSRRLLALPGTRAALIAALEAELRERCPGGATRSSAPSSALPSAPRPSFS